MQIDPFLLRALAVGIGVATVAGPIGCFVVWRRMAYVGDTMAHSALLGVAIGLLFSVPMLIGVLAATVSIALALVALQTSRPWLSSDALLGILAHSSLSFGLLAIGLMPWVRIDLLSYLFGDILSVTHGRRLGRLGRRCRDSCHSCRDLAAVARRQRERGSGAGGGVAGC